MSKLSLEKTSSATIQLVAGKIRRFIPFPFVNERSSTIGVETHSPAL